MARYAARVEKLLDGPPANDDPDEDSDWIRFDFPPGSTPEEIARILMESIRAHADDDKADA
jgi:hypothetical protein